MNTNVNAVLVGLSIGIFPNTRNDREITDEVKMRRALGNGAGKWVKYKLPDESLEAIRKFAGEIRKYHYDHTCCWEDGQQLLTSKMRPTYDARFNDYFEPEFWKLVDAFGERYPQWIEQAKIMHAGTFDQNDYPAWSECRKMFRLARAYAPVPHASHFTPEMKQLYGASLETAVAKKLDDAVTETWERLLKPVKAMADKLTSPEAIFRDSLIENVREMLALVPDLNFSADTGLKAAAKAIQDQLAALDPELLRVNKVERKEAADKAKGILERFGALGARKLAA